MPVGKDTGNIQPLVFQSSRRMWAMPIIGPFCVDWFLKSNLTHKNEYHEQQSNYLVFYCQRQQPFEKNWFSKTYTGVTLVALLFLLATISIYVKIWRDYGVHGLNVSCFCISTLGSYVF